MCLYVIFQKSARGQRPAEGKPGNATGALHTDPEKFFHFYLSRVASEFRKDNPAQEGPEKRKL
jgi:hypothetical protein